MKLLTDNKDTITLGLNSQGYNCPEWEDCDWSNSIIFMGAEEVFGTDSDPTLPQIIGDRLKTPVINLGYPKSSAMFHWANTVKLLSCNITPKAVVYIWPDFRRTMEFLDYEGVGVFNCFEWTIKSQFGQKWFRHKYQGLFFLKYFASNCKLMWKVPSYHFSVNDTEWFNLYNKETIIEDLNAIIKW